MVLEGVGASLHDQVVERLRAGSKPKECRSWLKAHESKSQDQAERIVRNALAAAELGVHAAHLFNALVFCDVNSDARTLRHDLAHLRCLNHRTPIRLLLRQLRLMNLCATKLLLYCAVGQLLKLAGCGSSATCVILKIKRGAS